MGRHLIFDLDDTLMLSKDGYRTNLHLAAEKLGLEVPEGAGKGAYQLELDDFARRCWPGVDIGAFRKEYLKISPSVVYKIVPGANEALQELHDRGHALYMQSNRGRQNFGLRVQQTGLRIEFFREILCRENLEYTKPDPRTFGKLLARIGYGTDDHRNRLYTGDTIDDMRASTGAGLGFVGVLTGFSTREEFLEAGLDAGRVLETVAGLPGFLAGGG